MHIRFFGLCVKTMSWRIFILLFFLFFCIFRAFWNPFFERFLSQKKTLISSVFGGVLRLFFKIICMKKTFAFKTLKSFSERYDFGGCQITSFALHRREEREGHGRCQAPQ